MALSTAQTQTVYEAVGLFAGGGTRYRYRFNAYSTSDIATASLTWDYSTVKTTVDTRLAALTAGEQSRLGEYITKYDDTATSSLVMKGEVNLDLAAENEKAANKIRQIVGLWVEPAPFVVPDGGATGLGGGRVVR